MASLNRVPILEERLDLARIKDWQESLILVDRVTGDSQALFSNPLAIINSYLGVEDPDLEKISELQRVLAELDNKRLYQRGLYREPNVDIPEIVDLYPAVVAFVDAGDDAEKGFGSGFFVSPRTLVTAYHVIQDYRKKPNNKKGILTKEGEYISLIGSRITRPNRRLDLALIEFEDDVHDMFLELSEEIPYLDPVIAAGYPLEVQPSEGIMSSFGAAYAGQNWCTCPAVMGFSGGPAFSLDGKVIGLLVTSNPESHTISEDVTPDYKFETRLEINRTGIVPSHRILKILE